MKKRIISVFLAVLMIVLLLPVQAFAAESVKGVYVGTEYESVIDIVMGAQSFSRGGNIPDGMNIRGSWSYHNTYGDYEFKLTLYGKPTKAGTYNFSVTYIDENKKEVQTVNYVCVVGEEAPFDFIDSIGIDKWPNKLVYYKGDKVDLTGLKVTAVAYKLNKELNQYEPVLLDITDQIWVEPEVFYFDEAQNVTVKFKAPAADGSSTVFSDSFRVSFEYANPEDVTRIEVYQKPTKLTYAIGEKLDTTGMSVRLHKGNGSAEDITKGFTVEHDNFDEVGTETVTVKYTQNNKEFTATFDVNVKEKAAENSASSSKPESTSTSTSSKSVSETSSESVSETSSESVSETSSESVSETSSEPESSEPQDIEVIGNQNENDNEGGIPFWVWIIVALLVVVVGAAVALFLIGRKRIDD